jgi:hypothetical protein
MVRDTWKLNMGQWNVEGPDCLGARLLRDLNIKFKLYPIRNRVNRVLFSLKEDLTMNMHQTYVNWRDFEVWRLEVRRTLVKNSMLYGSPLANGLNSNT